MLLKRLRLTLIMAPIALGIVACSAIKTPYSEETYPDDEISALDDGGLPTTAVSHNMRRGSFREMPGWKEDDVREIWPAFTASCSVLIRRLEWKKVCEQANTVNAQDKKAVRAFFESRFLPYKMIGADGNDQGLITGYYEPLLTGSRKRGGAYQTALHSTPPDLISYSGAGAQQQGKPNLKGRKVGGQIVPYWTRGELFASGLLKGREIVWVDDPVEAFFLQVQGSGRVYLPETGETIRLAYADQNGHTYKSIGRYLVDIGEMSLSEASAQSIKRWIKANPARERELFDANPRYVFFKEEKVTEPVLGPKGALNVPLTNERSIAIDPAMVPLGAPVYLATTRPNSNIPLQRLVMAQDTGSAIKGAVRADFFWGYGYEAGERAGSMKQSGKLWVLLPKAE
jgi:membrane-bound lytic murein transglycosylase A